MTFKNERYKGLRKEYATQWAIKNTWGDTGEELDFDKGEFTLHIPECETENTVLSTGVEISTLDPEYGNPMALLNLVADCWTNAALVEKQQEEIERLKFKLSIEQDEVKMFKELHLKSLKEQTPLKAELDALNAKYTPRPMSEAPRDGTIILGILKGTLGLGNFLLIYYCKDTLKRYGEPWAVVSNYVGLKSLSNDDLIGFFPADTFKGGGDE
jgi:hypothetical protein